MAKKLLVIRFSALGDVAMVVPILKELALAYPSWDITMLSKQQYETLFRGLPDNVHFFGADLSGHHSGILGLNNLLHDIDYKSFDAVADLHAVLRTLYLRLRCLWRGKHIAHIRKDRYQKWLLIRHFYRYKHPLRSTLSRYKSVFEDLGFELPNTSSFSITHSYTTDKSNIGIAPFAAHRGKIYPLDKMETIVEALGKAMAQKGEKVYLFGAGEKEKNTLTDWQKKYAGVECLVGRYSMEEEITLMKNLRLMVTMDSSNMHLASIVGTRVLSIWGATHPWAGFLGYGQLEEDCIQQTIPCRPCSIYGNRLCKFGDYRCLNIDPQTIIGRILDSISIHNEG